MENHNEKTKERLIDEESNDSIRLRLELALEASGLADWDFDFEKNTAHRSLRHDILYGYDHKLPKWNFDDFFHHVLPEFHQLAKDKFAALAHCDEIAFNYQIRKVNGELRWISLVGRGQRNSEGKQLRVAGTLKDITDEKEFESKVALQMMNITSLFEKAPEFFCIIRGPDLVYEYVNPAHRELFQGKVMTGLSVVEAQPELEGTEFLNALFRILQTGETIIFNDTPANIGNRVRYLDMVYAPRHGLHGEVDGIFALGSDVTDKTLARQRAEKSEEQMRLITDKLPAFISYTDHEGRYRFLNAMYADWFQKPISEMIGKTRSEITPPEYAIQSKPFQDQALEGTPSHHEGIIRRPDGKFLNLDINFVSDADPVTGAIRGMIAVGVDVTAQTKALKDAELARKELHEVFMQAPAPMCLLTGPDFVFTMANPRYVEYVQRDVLGKTLSEVFKGEDISLYQGYIRQVYSSGEALDLIQAPMDFLDANGRFMRKYMNVGYHPYKDSDGLTKGVLVIIQDVTEQVNSLIARDNFISIASHELKTPITSLKMQMQMNHRFLEKGKTSAFTPEALKKIFSTTVSQINRLTRLVDDMLDGSRISADHFKMNFVEVDFSKLVLETIENYLPQLQAAGIHPELHIDEGVRLMLDEARIEQVLVNLITNAIRYASGYPLQVTLSKSKDEVILKLKDHGMGIDPAHHSKIFERFERVNPTNDVTGLGLGLFISKKIVINHGGKISVASKIGKGAEFTVSIPIAQQ